MTSPLNQWIPVQFVKGPDTPAEWLQFDKQVAAVPPEYQSTLFASQANPMYLIGIRGYHQRGGPTGHQWVMSGPITGVMQAQFTAMPGSGGWADADARDTYRNAGLTLLADPYDVPGADVLAMFKSLYDAAVSNTKAQQQAVKGGGNG